MSREGYLSGPVPEGEPPKPPLFTRRPPERDEPPPDTSWIEFDCGLGKTSWLPENPVVAATVVFTAVIFVALFVVLVLAMTTPNPVMPCE